MDLRKVKKLIELVEESGVAELEVKSGEEAIRIVRPGGRGRAAEESAAAPASVQDAKPTPVRRRTTINAPMAGTFYAAPSPGAAPFVHLGARISVGDVLCIIESMKMMNEIPSEAAGQVVEVLATDGEPVSSSQALFRIE
ncbi:MAG: acetyl-CoA carboxylase biotin carboxyl carrier protein [Gammaproteobacteria bacterium]|nr:acetyl-CoA carboxylase biotin carboxyl carrier protein [Gammaproteobacteria bacterium]